MNEILVAIIVVKLDPAEEGWLNEGVCDITNAGGQRFSILASGNLSDDRMEFLHDWILVTKEGGEVLLAGSFSQVPTLADDEDEGIFNMGTGIAGVLSEELSLVGDEAYQVFDFIENAIWQVDPNYALEFLQLPHSAAVGSDDVEFSGTPKIYIHRSIGICEPAKCTSVEHVAKFMNEFGETAEFEEFDKYNELAVVIN